MSMLPNGSHLVLITECIGSAYILFIDNVCDTDIVARNEIFNFTTNTNMSQSFYLYQNNIFKRLRSQHYAVANPKVSLAVPK